MSLFSPLLDTDTLTRAHGGHSGVAQRVREADGWYVDYQLKSAAAVGEGRLMSLMPPAARLPRNAIEQ